MAEFYFKIPRSFSESDASIRASRPRIHGSGVRSDFAPSARGEDVFIAMTATTDILNAPRVPAPPRREKIIFHAIPFKLARFGHEGAGFNFSATTNFA
jgi:hypothetical protein